MAFPLGTVKSHLVFLQATHQLSWMLIIHRPSFTLAALTVFPGILVLPPVPDIEIASLDLDFALRPQCPRLHSPT